MIRSAAKIVLAIDTSTRSIGLSLYDGSQVLEESIWISHDYHTVELAPAVELALKRTGVKTEQLGLLAVALGPGSFTGLRIGLALAKGIAIANQIPMLGVATLDVLVAAQPLLDIPLFAVLRAGRGRLAVGRYQVQDDRWQSTAPVEVFTPGDLLIRIKDATTWLCGEFTEEEREFFFHNHPYVKLASPAQSTRRPGILAEIAWKRWQKGEKSDPRSLAPIYLHYNEPIPA